MIYREDTFRIIPSPISFFRTIIGTIVVDIPDLRINILDVSYRLH